MRRTRSTRARRVVAARVMGGPLAPNISGWVWFTPAEGGTWVNVSLTGLPPAQPGDPPIGPHGFHIHENGVCEVGDPDNPFTSAGPIWAPDGNIHPREAGTLPVLFSNGGVSKMRVFSNRFRPQDVIGRSVNLHIFPDDYRTQSAGNSGPRVACGVIRVYTVRRGRIVTPKTPF